jgi:hypothetical protein
VKGTCPPAAVKDTHVGIPFTQAHDLERYTRNELYQLSAGNVHERAAESRTLMNVPDSVMVFSLIAVQFITLAGSLVGT